MLFRSFPFVSLCFRLQHTSTQKLEVDVLEISGSTSSMSEHRSAVLISAH